MKRIIPIIVLFIGGITSPTLAGTRVGVNTGSQYGLRMGFQESISNGITQESSQSQLGTYAKESYTIESDSRLIDVNISTESFLDSSYQSVGQEKTSSFVYRTGVSFEQEYDTYGGF